MHYQTDKQRSNYSDRHYSTIVQFSLYINELLVAKGRKLIYANDIYVMKRRLRNLPSLNVTSQQIQHMSLLPLAIETIISAIA